MTMATNDIRVLALLLDVNRRFLSEPDDKLLALVYHQCAHQYHQGTFKSFYDSLPSDIAIRFMVDRRTLEWMLGNKCHFLVAVNKSTLADRLERGAGADIWYDAAAHSDDDVADLIDDTQAAMLEAAKLLREHWLDK